MATQGNDGSQVNSDGEQEPLHQQIAAFMKSLLRKPLVGLADNELEDIFEVNTPNYDGSAISCGKRHEHTSTSVMSQSTMLIAETTGREGLLFRPRSEVQYA